MIEINQNLTQLLPSGPFISAMPHATLGSDQRGLGHSLHPQVCKGERSRCESTEIQDDIQV